MTIDIDWNAAWKEDQMFRRNADNSEYWNNRAPSFAKTAGESPYAKEFLENAGILEGEIVFDMGCGSGTLALPLARAGHHVYACDFSEVMLDLMMERAELDGVAQFIHPVNLAWDEDWSRIKAPVCDVAFASRSIATADLQSALVKLDSMARRRVCLTLTTGMSPRTDSVLFGAIGRELPKYPDCVYAFNILWGMGITPNVRYIRSSRTNEFNSFEEAIDKTCEIFEATSDERTRLIEYSAQHLHEIQQQDGTTRWEYDHKRITSWAYISWDKEE
jgi:hypothetical protein